MPAARRIFRGTAWIVIVLLTCLLFSEVGLRQVMGNMATYHVVEKTNEPGECFYPIPGAKADYTGWWKRIDPVPVGWNEEGYRGPVRPLEPPAGTFRAVAIGDSYLYGLGVRYDDAFLTVAERALQADPPPLPAGHEAFEAVNLAVFGYNAVQYTDWFATHGRKLNPDLVLVFYTENDLDPDDCTLWDTRYFTLWLLGHSYTFRLLTLMDLTPGRFRGDPNYRENQGLADNLAAFERLDAMAREDGARLAVVFLSVDPRFEARLTGKLDTLDVPWTLVGQELGPSADSPNYIKGEDHYSVQGNRAVAGELERWLRGTLLPRLARSPTDGEGGAPAPSQGAADPAP